MRKDQELSAIVILHSMLCRCMNEQQPRFHCRTMEQDNCMSNSWWPKQWHRVRPRKRQKQQPIRLIDDLMVRKTFFIGNAGLIWTDSNPFLYWNELNTNEIERFISLSNATERKDTDHFSPSGFENMSLYLSLDYPIRSLFGRSPRSILYWIDEGKQHNWRRYREFLFLSLPHRGIT